MKMKVTNGEAVTLYENLANMLQDSKRSFWMNAMTSYAIVHNMRKLQTIAQDTLTVREKTLQQYSTDKTLENGTYHYTIPPENQETLQQELEALSDCVNEIDILTIPIDSLKDVSMTLQAMNAVFFMIEGEG